MASSVWTGSLLLGALGTASRVFGAGTGQNAIVTVTGSLLGGGGLAKSVLLLAATAMRMAFAGLKTVVIGTRTGSGTTARLGD